MGIWSFKIQSLYVLHHRIRREIESHLSSFDSILHRKYTREVSNSLVGTTITGDEYESY